MMTEAKIIFDNIKSLRHLLTEAVGENVIKDAIDNHEYVYLYYNGDDNVEKGYRTVRPMVLGKTGKGHMVLRAWQDKGRSQSLGAHAKRPPRPPAPKDDHERWTDTDGSTKPGWRLFRVDKISKIYPTGDKFEDEDGKALIPPKYREDGDDQMGGGRIAWVSTQQMKIGFAKADAMDKPTVIAKPDTGVPEVKRWKPFYNANPARRPMTPETIQKLYDIAMNVRKEKIGDLFVAIDDKNKFHFRPESSRDRFPQNAIVGNLKQLYDDLVLKNRQPTAAERDFANKELDKFNKAGNQNPTLFEEKNK